ncbi:MAG: hypothetical protein J6Q05_02100 [Elusimicrobiaceae bacterium]|nr:hypothetical protein [Elusimicrobiaceae bacterium]
MKKLVCLLLLAICLPALAQDKKHNWEIAYEHSKYTYKEPHMANPIKDYGHKNGVSIKYLQRSVLTPGDVTDSDHSFAALDFRYMSGDVTYKGWLKNLDTGEVTPNSESGIKDYYFEASLKIGAVYRLADPLDIWPYLGLGWRQLRNHSEKGIGGYQRTSTYIYLPLGTNLRCKVSDTVSFTLNGQFDVLLHGNQYSRMSDVWDGDDSSNRQNQGYGIRASVRGDVNLGKVGLFIEPFWRYWHIQNSNEEWFYEGGDPTKPVLSLVEPFNTTSEWGIRAGITF